jgi:uncharacterized protein (TIGR02466 family)
MSIELCFPTVMFKKEDLFSATVNEEWSNYILGLEHVIQRDSGAKWWDDSTYTTHNTNAIASGPFDDLLKAATENVNALSMHYGSTAKLKVIHSWANIAREKDRQDYHCHQGSKHSDSIFSAVYYIKVPTGSSNILFQDPRESHMLPLKGIVESNPLNMNVLEYEAKEGRLLIFRSSLRHCVPEGTNTEPRISLAINFGYY